MSDEVTRLRVAVEDWRKNHGGADITGDLASDINAACDLLRDAVAALREFHEHGDGRRVAAIVLAVLLRAEEAGL